MDKIRACFHSKYGEAIPYKMYTYGELATELVAEGLALYNDLKLKFQLYKERAQNKTALGHFWQQFGYENILKDSSHKKTKPNRNTWPKRPPPSKRWSSSKIICSKRPAYKGKDVVPATNQKENPNLL